MTDKYESSSPQECAIVLQEIVLFFWASSSMLLTISWVTQWLYKASYFSLIVPLERLTLLQPFVKSYSIVWQRTRHNVCETKRSQPHNSVEVSKPKNCLLPSGNQHLHISSLQALSKWNHPLPVSALTLTPLPYCSSLMCDGVQPRMSLSWRMIGRAPCCACLLQEVGISAQFLSSLLTPQSNMCIFTGRGATWGTL